jgi:exopolyphosphatase / guanosine-5'-triphosphate,3'-diphosphate pyrophosphatase
MAATPDRRGSAGEVLAALDIGTNSFHLVIARITGSGFEVVTRAREMVRLGHGGGDMKEISAEAMERGVAALGRMQALAAAHGAPIRAVATSAVREAANADEFIGAAAGIGVDVEVISGLEEARLIYLGVLQAVPVFDRQVLVVDVGGGSTEVVVGAEGLTHAARSFKLGAVRLTDRFFPAGKLTPAAVTECRAFVRSVLSIFRREVVRLGFETAVASSGTADAVARMVHAASGEPAPVTFNGFEFTRKQLDGVVKALTKRRTAEARRSVPGLEATRADIAVAGALVLQAVAETFDVPAFVYSEAALREGVLLDTIERHTGGTVHHLRDVSRRSIAALAARCDDDPEHSGHVAGLALELFARTRPLHRLPPETADYLEAAALLANVGLVISHSRHHLHSYYVIRHSELTGLTDEEIEIVAQVARYHRKSAPKASHPEFAALDEPTQRLVRVLAGILRVAIALDRTHDQRVTGIDVRISADLVRIIAHRRDGSDIELELYTANERSELLAEVLGRIVEIVPDDATVGSARPDAARADAAAAR